VHSYYYAMDNPTLPGVDLEKDIVTCPGPLGGCLLFNQFTPHRRFV
jgi:hypothetical protein